jgi:type II secretory pathway predicted ATPase ExeA
MYETYFNLTERPFASVPRIDHFYPAAVIDAARHALARCIDRGEGVGLIIGPSGTGKSLLCHVLAEQFQSAFQVALLASTHLDTRRSLLQAMLYELNRPYRGMDEGELRLSLVDYITLNDDCGRGVVLLVDEAHHLPLRLLDEIRSLTNLTRDLQPAVRMVLVGSHVLEERFASPKLESFSQRISTRCYLEAFQRSETQAYIQTRISACGGRGIEIFPAETCQMVHKASDGVPRLINQVCDHVLLLAYAAGIRRIEPAHVEEAWADLQQLPTPWNAQAVAAAPSGDSVIEFGGLDDASSELPPIAGKIAATDDACPAEASLTQPTLVAETTEDPETFEQLRHIQKLLADVEAEFQPAATIGPEVELVFKTPHPFGETFEEEEVIADRYAAAVAPAAADASAAEPAPCAAVAAEVEAEPVTTREGREAPQLETIPMPHGRKLAWKDARESEVAAATVAAVAEEPAPRPTRSVVPPRRQEFGRLFAKLRQGL